jgi:YggT family protein
MIEILPFFLILLLYATTIFTYAIYASIILSWVLALNLVNPYNPTVSFFINIIYTLTEPILNQIRKIIPFVGPFDFSPLVALFLTYGLKSLILNLLARF